MGKRDDLHVPSLRPMLATWDVMQRKVEQSLKAGGKKLKALRKEWEAFCAIHV